MKKFMRTTCLLVVPLLAAMSTQAQVTFGPRLGLNLSNVNYDYSDVDFKNKPESTSMPGAQIGFAVNAQLGNLALQPALLFSMKGNKVEASSSTGNSSYKSKGSSRLNYAELPVNLVYSTKGAEGGFQVFAGPYVAWGLSGKTKIEASNTVNGVTQTQKVEADVAFISEEGSDLNKDYVRNLDYGLNAGVGYKVGGVQVQLGYGLGLGNRVPEKEGNKPDIKVHNRNIQLALTYLFQ